MILIYRKNKLFSQLTKKRSPKMFSPSMTWYNIDTTNLCYSFTIRQKITTDLVIITGKTVGSETMKKGIWNAAYWSRFEIKKQYLGKLIEINIDVLPKNFTELIFLIQSIFRVFSSSDRRSVWDHLKKIHFQRSSMEVMMLWFGITRGSMVFHS